MSMGFKTNKKTPEDSDVGDEITKLRGSVSGSPLVPPRTPGQGPDFRRWDNDLEMGLLWAIDNSDISDISICVSNNSE